MPLLCARCRPSYEGGPFHGVPFCRICITAARCTPRAPTAASSSAGERSRAVPVGPDSLGELIIIKHAVLMPVMASLSHAHTRALPASESLFHGPS